MSMSALLVALLLLVGVVRGSYVVEVRVHSYRNPSGRCDGCRVPGNPVPGCCDEGFIRSRTSRCPQNETCDTGIAYCIRSSGQTQECQLNQAVPSRYFGSNTNNLNFGDDILGLPNPIEEFDFEAWRGITITFVTVDCNSMFCNFQPLLIDSIPVDILIPVGTARPETEYIGNAGLVRLSISFEVRCREDFYGEDCLTFCPDFDSCDGCGLTGFTGEFCQFGVANCRQRYCNGNGDCLEGEPECDCDAGFTEDFCQENINDCVDVNCNNGRCEDEVDGFTCLCDSGFTGDLCREEIGAASANVGGIVGGVIGGLIVIIIVAIIVVLAVLALSRGRRSNKQAFSEENRSPSGIIPIDNPSYGASGARNGPNQVQVPDEGVTVIGRTEHLPSTSLQEREFVNPIYSTNTATEPAIEAAVPEPNEDRYTEVESRYTVPNSTPRNVYERIDDSSRESEVASGGSGVYYSVVTT